MRVVRMVYTEFYKLIHSRGWWLILGLVILIQPLFGLLEAKQLVAIGLDATPQTQPELLEAIPPLDYFGFDATQFGLLPIVIWGGISGASAYQNHNLRVTLLYSSRRLVLFSAKIITLIASTVVVSFISTLITVIVTHMGMASLGLNPITLSPIAWMFIGYTVIQWTLLTAIAFAIGLLCRHMIVPLVFLIPQIYNLGNYLAQRWSWGNYLPVAASNMITATPVKTIAHEPLKGAMILILWLSIMLIMAGYTFVRNDVGGNY